MKTVKDTNAEYHSKKDYISASGLKMIAKKSVHHYLNADFKSTPSMAFGTAVHTAIYEPSEFYKDYHIIPKIDRRTKAWQRTIRRTPSESRRQRSTRRSRPPAYTYNT